LSIWALPCAILSWRSEIRAFFRGIEVWKASIDPYGFKYVISYSVNTFTILGFAYARAFLEFQVAMLIIVATAALVIVVFTMINGISPMPSSEAVAQEIVDVCKRHKTQGLILELGSGWGGLSIRLATKFPDAKVVGYENCPVPYLWSQFVTLVSLRRNVKILLADFYRTDFSDAAMVVCYLCPSAMQKLSEKLQLELRPSSLIVSSTFALPGWQPVEVRTTADTFRSKVYVYKC